MSNMQRFTQVMEEAGHEVRPYVVEDVDPKGPPVPSVGVDRLDQALTPLFGSGVLYRYSREAGGFRVWAMHDDHPDVKNAPKPEVLKQRESPYHKRHLTPEERTMLRGIADNAGLVELVRIVGNLIANDHADAHTGNRLRSQMMAVARELMGKPT